MKQKEMARWLRGLTIFSVVALVAFALALTPLTVARLEPMGSHGQLWLVVGGFGLAAIIPAFWGLSKVWVICGEITANNSFCKKNAYLLRDISRLCVADAVIFLAAALWVVVSGHTDIFILLVLFLFSFFGVFLAVAAAALSHLTDKASKIKDENDLTI